MAEGKSGKGSQGLRLYSKVGERPGSGHHRKGVMLAQGMNGRNGSLSHFLSPKETFRIVEGFRAPAGVLNPDVYDPRSLRR